MSNLYISARYNGYHVGESLPCAAYLATDFVQYPKDRSPVPHQAAVNTQTTDSSGNAEFTGLSTSSNYWVMVQDNDGNHWTYVMGNRVGNSSGDRVVCTWTRAAVPAPTVQQITSEDGSVTIDPPDGQGIVDLSASGGGSGIASISGAGVTTDPGYLDQDGDFSVFGNVTVEGGSGYVLTVDSLIRAAQADLEIIMSNGIFLLGSYANSSHAASVLVGGIGGSADGSSLQLASETGTATATNAKVLITANGQGVSKESGGEVQISCGTAVFGGSPSSANVKWTFGGSVGTLVPGGTSFPAWGSGGLSSGTAEVYFADTVADLPNLSSGSAKAIGFTTNGHFCVYNTPNPGWNTVI